MDFNHEKVKFQNLGLEEKLSAELGICIEFRMLLVLFVQENKYASPIFFCARAAKTIFASDSNAHCLCLVIDLFKGCIPPS